MARAASRCGHCGRLIYHEPYRCRDHPAAELVSLSTALERACIYVAELGRKENGNLAAVQDAIEHADLRYWPGVTRAELRVALLYWDRWGRDDLPERRLPVRAPAATNPLFGPLGKSNVA